MNILKGFYRKDNILVKIYSDGQDWQVLLFNNSPMKDTIIAERWYTITKQRGLLEAFTSIMCEHKLSFNLINFVSL